jgi:hypothetical protein
MVRSREVGEARPGASGCDWSQHSIKQANYSAVETCVDDDDDDDDVANASPFKWDCHHTCTESLHTGNNARLVSMG